MRGAGYTPVGEQIEDRSLKMYSMLLLAFEGTISCIDTKNHEIR